MPGWASHYILGDVGTIKREPRSRFVTMSDSIFAPRSLPARGFILVHVTPRELHRLIRLLEDDAVRAAEDVDQEDFADYLFQRVAALREAGR
jgi:hypothetical protein